MARNLHRFSPIDAHIRVMLLFVYTYFGVMYSHRFWLIVAPSLFSFLIPAI